MRRSRKILFGLGVASGMLLLAAALYHCHLKSVNEAYIAELIARGEPMALAQVLPPAENSADTRLAKMAWMTAGTSRWWTQARPRAYTG